jgi:hypothetical protein
MAADTQVTPNRRLLHGAWFAAVALLIVALLPRLLLVSLPSGRSRLIALVDYLNDDAYYYLGIAANVVDLGKSSMDGVTATNGYHPLWLAFLSALAKAVGTETWTLFVATFWLIAVLAVVAVIVPLLLRDARARQVGALAATGLAVSMLQNWTVFLGGMEPLLTGLLFVPLVVLLEGDLTPRNMLKLSAILAGVFLSRIDALVVFGAVALVAAISIARAPASSAGRAPGYGAAAAKPLLALAVIVVPVVLAYLVLNKIMFDSAVPVSGLAKSIGGPKFANFGIFSSFFGRPAPLLVLAALLLILEFLARRAGRVTTLFHRTLAVFFIATVVQALYYSAFSTWPGWPWYAYLAALLGATLMARIIYLAACLVAGRGVLRYVGWTALAALLVFDLSKFKIYAADSIRLLTSREYQAAQLAPAEQALTWNQITLQMLETPLFAQAPQMQVGMGDRAGGLVYWGRERVAVAQAEGLTLDRAYIAARVAGTAEQYFENRFALRYWIVDREVLPLLAAADGSREFVVAEPIQGRLTRDAVPVFCFPEDASVYTRTYGRDTSLSTHYVFDFAKRRPCSPAARAWVAQALSGAGLRRLSLPGEYDLAHGGWLSSVSEQRDRARGHAAQP